MTDTQTDTLTQTKWNGNITPPQFRGGVIKTKKHSENTDTSTSVTFDLDV